MFGGTYRPEPRTEYVWNSQLGGGGVSTLSIGCDNWDAYDYIYPSNTPIKTIRVTVHIFQKNDGTGNFNTNDIFYLRDAINAASNSLGSLPVMTQSTYSPHYSDSRIRWQIVGTYFWPNDEMWAKSNRFNALTNGTAMYNYVMNQASVQNKDNSVHLLFPGKPTDQNPNQQGGAAVIGQKEWAMFDNIYGNGWPEPIIRHELGHCLGLQHPVDVDQNNNTIARDVCNDTPDPPQGGVYGGGQENNMMNYNACECALTRCQISRMHWFLLGNGGGNIRDALINPSTPPDPVVSGPGCVSTTTGTGGSYAVDNYQFGWEVSWSTTPANKVVTSSGCGGVPVYVLPVSGATGTATTGYTVDRGTYGSRSTSISYTFVTGELIAGTVNGSTLGTINYMSSTTGTVNVSAAGASSFTWTKTSGNGTWSSSNQGQTLQLNIASGGHLSFTVSTNSSTCGNLSRTLTFIPAASFYTFYPNPSADELFVSAKPDFAIEYTDENARKQTLSVRPMIEQINLYDQEGNLLMERKLEARSKQASIHLGKLKAGLYYVELKDGTVSVKEKIIKQ